MVGGSHFSMSILYQNTKWVVSFVPLGRGEERRTAFMNELADTRSKAIQKFMDSTMDIKWRSAKKKFKAKAEKVTVTIETIK